MDELHGGEIRGQEQCVNFSKDNAAYNYRRLGDGQYPVWVPYKGFVQKLLESIIPEPERYVTLCILPMLSCSSPLPFPPGQPELPELPPHLLEKTATTKMVVA